MKKRVGKLIGILFLVLLLGIGYACFWSLTGISIPCPIRRITGFYCPGCGVSRMFLALLKFQFKEAFHYNPAVFCLLPALAYLLVRQALSYIRGEQLRLRFWEEVAVWGIIALLFLFGIVRNLPAFSYLAPPA